MIELRDVSGGGWWGARARLAPGVHPLTASPRCLDSLFDWLEGLSVPSRGELVVAGERPSVSPRLRARLGIVRLEEQPLPAPSVVAALDGALRLRGHEALGRDALECLGLATWAQRRPADLDARERRCLQLALALALPEPLVVAVREPSAYLPSLDQERLRALLRRRAEEGACVLLASVSPRELEPWGELSWRERAGRLEPPRTPLSAEATAGRTALRVRCTEPAALLAALSALEAPLSPHLEGEELVLTGAPLAELALALAQAAVASDGAVLSVQWEPA